ncbi:hypothetical protein ACODNH_18535 [Haloarcula sp. NS06]|uniref:hypothetical protein n=1 Tax=unclassified Haloarcula TaxID=2624677 RepID=UPI0027B7737C|nr:hypothetical protein [Haloarcula sp. H-GB4]MDQ2072266.1 hypothetical protein [Haloarcula sp. H-GB4]
MGDTVLNNFPTYPETVPLYTADGVRMGMPPFGAIIAALVAKIISPLTAAMWLPLLFHVVATLVGTYAVLTYVRDSGSGKLISVLAGSSLAVSPSVYFWHVTAGGTVRTLGYILYLSLIAISIRLFRGREGRLLAVATLLTGLAISTHPFYGFMSCLAVLAAFLAFDPTVRTFRWGVLIAVGSLLVAAIWLLPSILNHGLEMYLNVSGSRNGLFQWTWNPVNRIYTEGWRGTNRPFWVTLGLFGTLTALIKRRTFLLLLLAFSTYFTPRPRFIIVPLVTLAALFLVKDGPTYFTKVARGINERRLKQAGAILAVLSLVIVPVATGLGAVGANAPPSFIRSGGLDAAEWAKTNTESNASFMVGDDFAEWWPLLSDRRSLVAPRGAEWDHGERQTELEQRRTIQSCKSADCLRKLATSEPISTDYVVVPVGRLVTGLGYQQQSPELHPSLQQSANFSLVYQNSDYAIYEFTMSNN